MTRTSLLALALSLTAPWLATAQQVDYEQEIKPILKQHCYSCHGALKQEVGLRLDSGTFIHQGGEDGPVLTPGQLENSSLLERITTRDEAERMPPDGKPLTELQLQQIHDWVAQGAEFPENEQVEEDPREHWAFKRPVRVPIPSVNNADWVRNPIDAFVAKQHQERGLTPLRPAENHVLLRRVYLDLIGLPPSREQLADFLNDKSPDAYEKVVNRLLNSPQYGERWGRHWMDVWRYSDWYGRRGVPDCLNSYGQIWRWRDWIVRSLNENKGYDRMVMEMLAADEIAPDDEENIVATGFIVRNFYRWNYNTWMKDIVEHTGKAFLGLTLNCCHCHDHKYDPIANEEYFRFRAFFEPIEIRHDRVVGEPDPGPYPEYTYGAAYKPIGSGLVRIMDVKLDAQTFVYTDGESRNVVPDQPPVIPAGPAVLGVGDFKIEPVRLPATSWYPGLKAFVRHAEIAQATAELSQAENSLAESQQSLVEAKDDATREAAQLAFHIDQLDVVRATTARAALQARIHADRVRYQNHPGSVDEASRLASRAESQAILEAARLELARADLALASALAKQPADQDAMKTAETKVSEARQALQEAEEASTMESSEYTPLGPTYPKQSTGRRAALARWITRQENPLPARVAVNHIWLRHFGRAFVETTDNFGRSGARPTHPELLDWLTVELMENGWQMKHLHRLIVTSNTYRMASSEGRTGRQLVHDDLDNIFLWRFNANRMEAEVLRDSVLQVSGALDATFGGKAIEQELGLTTPRRSLYFEHHGEGLMQLLDLFDGADPCDAYRRTTSVRPQQALALANSELTVQQGRLLARRLADRIDHQPPRDREIEPVAFSGPANSSAARSESATDPSQWPGRHTTFISAAFAQILSRSPTPAEATASKDFLERQIQLFKNAKQEELESVSEDEPVAPATDPLARARENFIQALFSHHDFVTIR
ncbi:MAG: colicin uptake protein [Planctomycetaceae bacterium]|nr:colicin uptake protein [Planctomycetaceae bacterium]